MLTVNGIEYLYGATLDTAVAKGTWTASGTWTIPAVTLGGTVTGGGQAITGIVQVLSSDSTTVFYGSSVSTGPYLYFAGKDHAGNGEMYIATPNAAEDAPVNRIHLTGDADTAVLTLSAVTVTGLVITSGQGITGGSHIQLSSDLTFTGATTYIQTHDADDSVTIYRAIDNDGAAGAYLEIARAVSANNPYFSFGGSQQNKFYNDGSATFTGVVTHDVDIWIANGYGLVTKGSGNLEYVAFTAWDVNGAVSAEVARFVNANDPYFSFGGSQQHKFYNSGAIDFGSAAVLACVGTGANGMKLKNLKNAAATALSGTQLDVEIDIGGTPYYFTVYPTKA